MHQNEFFLKIYKHIKDWQKEHDNEFKCLPIDNHAYILFNNKNEECKFIFSNYVKMDECNRLLPYELLDNYQFVKYSESEYKYYLIIKGD